MVKISDCDSADLGSNPRGSKKNLYEGKIKKKNVNLKKSI